MRVPTGKSLASWIRELEEEGELYKFDKPREGIDLKVTALSDNHYECAHCKLKQPAKYSRATQVHRVNEGRVRPDLALGRTDSDEDGEHDNLVPLCLMCHNSLHGRFGRAEDKPQLNKERW